MWGYGIKFLVYAIIGFLTTGVNKEVNKMSGIALYNVLIRLGATPDEAEKAVAEIANSKEMATKADLKTGIADLKTEMTEKISDAKNTMILWVAGVGIVILLAVLFK